MEEIDEGRRKVSTARGKRKGEMLNRIFDWKRERERGRV